MPVSVTEKSALNVSNDWPELPWAPWQDTIETVHMWTQIIGKIRLALAPRVNHWWHVTLYPSSTGLTTSPMPYGSQMLEIAFDFVSHQLRFQASSGQQESFALKPMSVASFYQQVMVCLNKLSMPVALNTTPCEIAEPIPFDKDEKHHAYDAEYVSRFWKVILNTNRVFSQFRAQFLGKVSPVHFFWGGFDLAVTRFSGRLAPKHGPVPYIPDSVVQTAYSHEVSSCGFWPGGPTLPEPIFYSYAYPAPEGYAKAVVSPNEAYFLEAMGEFVLPYEAVRKAENPDEALMAFLQTTYNAAADLAKWNRQELEASGPAI